MTVKTCVGWFGRKFLFCYFPLAATEEHEEGCIFLAGIMGSVMISAFKRHAKAQTGPVRFELLRVAGATRDRSEITVRAVNSSSHLWG